MPKIVISGISEEVVRTVAPRLIPAVAEALACPVEWISFEYVPSVYFAAEADKERCPMVEVQATCGTDAEDFQYLLRRIVPGWHQPGDYSDH